jgi:hypothetical protein
MRQNFWLFASAALYSEGDCMNVQILREAQQMIFP